MAQFVRIGNKRINLERVTHTLEFPEQGFVHVFLDAPEMNPLEKTGQACIHLGGNEAKRLLLILDFYDASPQHDDYNVYQAQHEQALIALDALAMEPEPDETEVQPAHKLCAECEQRPDSEPGYIWMRTDTEPWDFTCEVCGAHWSKHPDIPF